MNDPFTHIYKGAKELEAAEKSKNISKLKQLDFGVGPQVCTSPLYDLMLTCSNCEKCIRCGKPCINMSTGKWTVRGSAHCN